MGKLPASQAASMPALAFQSVFGKSAGGAIVSFSLLLFVLSTIIVIVFTVKTSRSFI